MQPARCLGDIRTAQGERCAAELAGDPDVVAGARAAAIERDARRHFADRHDADGAQRRARGVAADQLDAEALGEREEAGGKFGQPVLLHRRQADREQRPARRRAHRSEVRKVHRERLVPEGARCGVGGEMAALHQHVGRQGELEAGVGTQQRAVVPHAEQRAFGRAREIARDELELGQAGLRARATSSGRRRAAIFSSTPFTKRWPSAAP